MRGVSLLTGLTVMLGSVSGQDKVCGAGQQCVGSASCESFTALRQEFNQLPTGPDRDKLLLTLRSLVCNKKERKVCCEVAPGPTLAPVTESVRDITDSPSYLPSLEREECGLAGGSLAFVLGGEETGLGQFPFLALVGKTGEGRRRTKWDCGGSIINKWFVISAAHCGSTVNTVRLGEWRVVEQEEEEEEEEYKGRDCQFVRNIRLCSEPHQDIAVAAVTVHPDYDVTPRGLAVNDIMLLKLSRPAVFNDFVQPVCLPSPRLAQYGEAGTDQFGHNVATLVGWGKTTRGKTQPTATQTEVQQRLETPVLTTGTCLSLLEDILNLDLSQDLSPEHHLCAGGLTEAGGCSGDSGGPLMAREDDLSPWQLVGVLSGGPKRCGNGAPDIFTRLSHYTSWIIDNLN